MAKAVSDAVLDAALDKIATATIQTACSAQPTTRTEAVTTYALADVTIDGTDFTNANGDTSGRKVTVAQQTGVTVDASGDASHVALCDGSDLLYVTTCTTQTLTSGNTMTFSSWKVEIGDPT
jgi:hypothetical protein